MSRKIRLSIFLSVVGILIVPVLFGNMAGVCPLASAQDDNPCLKQDATISALKLENLELKTTLAAAYDFVLQAATVQAMPPMIITVPVIITATQLPTAQATWTPLATRAAATWTPLAAATASALPPGCTVYTVVAGDTPFGIAEHFGIDGLLLLEANGLDEAGAADLRIGDTLIIPLEGCPVDQIQQAARPTLAPTAANAQLTIERIEGAGDIATEGIRFTNHGNTINATGWRLSDLDGTVYTFGGLLIFSNTSVTLYTRAGQNTPIALFWGLDKPVWNPGDIVTLADAKGQVQATGYVDELSKSP